MLSPEEEQSLQKTMHRLAERVRKGVRDRGGGGGGSEGGEEEIERFCVYGCAFVGVTG